MEKEDFKALFDKYYIDIKHFLYYKSGDEKLAEDLTQDVFFTLWEKRDKICTETAGSLLYKIALNSFISKHRKNILKYNFQNNLITNLTSESPQYLMEYEELKIRYQNALSSLPDKQRIVFLMNRIDGHTFKKIAESLSISVKTVEKRMKVALDKIEKIVNIRM